MGGFFECFNYPAARVLTSLGATRLPRNEPSCLAVLLIRAPNDRPDPTTGVGHGACFVAGLAGSSIDWMKGRADVRYAFALELRDDGPDNFELPATEIIPTGQEAFCAVSVLAETVDADDRRSGASSRLPPSAVFRVSVVALVVFKRVVYGR